MRETKRERAIKILSQIRELYPFLNCDDEFDQAISDMEKLEKIEQIIDNSTFHPNNYMASVELLKIIKKIDQIVKG